MQPTENRAGVRLPLKLCVEKCKSKKPRYIILTGELAISMSPTAQQIQGALSMHGFWFKAFGMPMLHFSHIRALIGVDVKIMLPTKIEVGVMACLGSQQTCQTKKGKNFIRAGAFVGIDATNPSSNYMMVMTTEI